MQDAYPIAGGRLQSINSSADDSAIVLATQQTDTGYVFEGLGSVVRGTVI